MTSRGSDKGFNIRSPKPANTKKKKSIPGPTNVSSFISMLVMRALKKILLIDTGVKIGVYIFGVFVASFISDFFPLPRTYLASKNSVFNQYFVKLGWGWTSCLLAGFIILTSYTYSCGNWKHVFRHLGRIAVGTINWFIWTKLFVIVEHASGICTKNNYVDKTSCLSSGHLWLGFDISGHTFLLIHCLLMISEEVKCIKRWEKIPDYFQTDERQSLPPSTRLTEQQITVLKVSYSNLSKYMKVNAILIVLLMVLWEMMLLITSLYYHTLLQKMAGALIAVGVWFMTYQVWYRMNVIWSPGLPGYGTVQVI